MAQGNTLNVGRVPFHDGFLLDSSFSSHSGTYSCYKPKRCGKGVMSINSLEIFIERLFQR